MPVSWKSSAALAALAGALAAAGAVRADPVLVYSAGSLRGVVGDLAKEAAPLGIEVQGQFGGSGAMRERIEKGEAADLFMSADIASPRKLQAENKTALPVIAFARNRECIVSRKALGITPANLVDKLLQPGVRIKTSQPVSDPSGDYAFAIFDKMDAAHPGAGAKLKAKANAMMDVTVPAQAAGPAGTPALFAANKIDVTITYCSGGIEKQGPGLASFPVPPAFDPHPVYGVAVLTNKPDALRLALYLLSDKGQAIVAREGLVPLLDSPP